MDDLELEEKKWRLSEWLELPNEPKKLAIRVMLRNMSRFPLTTAMEKNRTNKARCEMNAFMLCKRTSLLGQVHSACYISRDPGRGEPCAFGEKGDS